MNQLNPDFKHYLSGNGINEAVIDVLIDQEIGWQNFPELSQDDLLGIGIKMGSAKALLKLITEFNNSPQESIYVIGDDGILKPVDALSNTARSQTSDSLVSTANHSEDTTSLEGEKTADKTNYEETSYEEPSSSQPGDDFIPNLNQENTIDYSLFTSSSSLRDFLQQHPQGEAILGAIDDNKMDEKIRRNLVRILVAELINVAGSYPTSLAKWALARAIVTEFAILKNPIGAVGCEHFYDPKSGKGFLHYRLENTRKYLPSEKKKNVCAKKKKQNLESILQENNQDLSAIELKVQLMLNTNPANQNKKMIEEWLLDTFIYRREYINTPIQPVDANDKTPPTTPTITQILTKFPRMLDFNCEFVHQEFESLKITHRKDGILSVFPVTYVKKILKYAAKHHSNKFAAAESFTDDNLKALILLIEILPKANFSVKRKKSTATSSKLPNEKFMRILPNGSSVDEFLKTLPIDVVQPSLLAITSHDAPQKITSFFIIADRRAFQLPSQSTALYAVSMLWKVHYVFNVEYAAELRYFFNFIDAIVQEKKDCRIFASVNSLNTLLMLPS
ncbi:uncharacterized protein LOC135849148 isoform X2 [Planococcus citri]|uniref:uncharacterized protein LOC135833989 isoform X2 n=1 Tax=Planococcus citri TaxID=170843 RepID=UPI0031F929E8